MNEVPKVQSEPETFGNVPQPHEVRRKRVASGNK
jgi:hypothetical protein